jgi:hypothetical protein
MLTAQEDLDLRKLIDRLDRCVDPWCAKTNDRAAWPEAEPGSALANGDAAADPYLLSTVAWHSITAAVDELRCLRDSLFESRTPSSIQTIIRSHSQYTLLRAALENASWAVWVLAPDIHEDRIIRRLRVQASSIDSMARLAKNTKIPLVPDKTQQMAKLRAVAAGGGLTSGQMSAAAKPASNAEVIRDAATTIGADPSVALAVWSMGSGVAHADFQSTLLFLDRKVAQRPDPGRSLLEITGSIRNIYLGTLAATAAIDAAFTLYTKRCST